MLMNDDADHAQWSSYIQYIAEDAVAMLPARSRLFYS